jgi:predicted NAD/FAD-binding protein
VLAHELAESHNPNVAGAHDINVRERMRIAVIGAGVTGLAAARALDNRYDVTLFEKCDHLGGHACTVDVAHYGPIIPVDCGFIVYNRKTYPLLTGLFRQLGVKPKATGMEFSVSLDEGRFEWAVGSLNSMFAQRRNFLDPRFYLMLLSILRFFRVANADLAKDAVGNISLGGYLERHKFSRYFALRFLVPMCRSIWSSSVEEVFSYPAPVILNFLFDHGLLSVKQPIWLTLEGGARTYVDAITNSLKAKVRLGTKIVSIDRKPTQINIMDDRGAQETFDHVVLACHAPEALALLREPSASEREILGAFRYASNTVVLHGDSKFMPTSRRGWASWNYRGYLDSARNSDPVILTYWMNKIQHIPDQYPLFVTLNPPRAPDVDLEFARFEFEHPQFDDQSVSAQARLQEIQGGGNVWFCGAYCRYGFHEDGYSSGLRAAECVDAAIRSVR